MYDVMIADLLDQCIDLDEEITTDLIESQLKCLAGIPAESTLDLSA